MIGLVEFTDFAEQNIAIKEGRNLKMKKNKAIPVELPVKPANGELDYDFIVRVMLSMTGYPDLLPENIRIEKAKLSKWYDEFYDKKEPHILARIKWLKDYIESRLSV